MAAPPPADTLPYAIARINRLQEQVDALIGSNIGPPPGPPPPSAFKTPAAEPNPLVLPTIGPKMLTEVIGTLMLTFTVGMTAADNPNAPLAIGGILIAMIFAGGHISGAHYNPTVTVAIYCRGMLSFPEVLMYIGSQICGAFLGAGIARAFTGEHKFGYPTFTYYGHACLIEFIWGLLLAMTVLTTATSSATTNNSYYGLAIGSVVMAGAVVVGPISGGAFNGAVGLALQVVALDASKCWVYLLCPTLGGAAAGLLFHFTSLGDFKLKFANQKLAADIAAFLMEFFTTFYLALYLALRPYHSTNPLSSVALFALVVALCSTGGAASGAHMNPAVSLGVFTRFKIGTTPATRNVFPIYKLLYYILAQLLGALAASGIGCTLMYTDIVRPLGFPMPPNPTRFGQVTALFAEMGGTFVLLYVFLNVCTVKTVEGNSYFGIAIAMTITAIGEAIGGVSGGCLNPSLALLTAVRAAFPAGFSFAPIWIYFVGPPLGALLGAVIFRVQNLDEYDEHLPPKVHKRYSAMTDGMEHETQYHSNMRVNEGGHAAKTASSMTENRRRSKLTSIIELDMSPRPSGRDPSIPGGAVQKLSMSAIEAVEESEQSPA